MTMMIPAWIDGTLVPVEKLDAHVRGLRHKAVSVFVLRGDQMLIQQRALGKYHTPGLWANTCCTHPGWNEGARDTAVRRLEEELGITGQDPRFAQQVEYRANVGGGLVEHEVVDIFIVHATADMPLDPRPDEVMAVRWISFAKLFDELASTRDAFTPWMRIYMQKHADEIFGDALVTAS